MRTKTSRWLSALSLTAAVAVGATIVAPMQASAADCNGRSGSLRLWDSATGQCGYFAGDNRSWGPYGWSHRTEGFYNQGNSHNVKIYEFANYAGSWAHLYRYESWSWFDYGDSNYWTTDGK